MTSASVAVKRLQSESLQQKTLNELKQDAVELGLSKEDVKQFGSLSYKQTWLDAIGNAIANEFEAVETATEDQSNSEEQVSCPSCDGHGGFVDDDDESGWQVCSWCHGDRVVPVSISDNWEDLIGQLNQEEFFQDFIHQSEASPLTSFTTTEDIPKKLLTLTESSPTPLRDELTQQMADYVGDCISPQEFEALQNEPLDEYTAAVYLGWLEESKRMVTEALAA